MSQTTIQTDRIISRYLDLAVIFFNISQKIINYVLIAKNNLGELFQRDFILITNYILYFSNANGFFRN